MIRRRAPLRRTPIRRKTPIKRSALVRRSSPIKRASKPIARQRIRVTAKTRARKAAERVVIQRVRGNVFARAQHRCERCGAFHTEANPLQMHEAHSRAQTRGCQAYERFDERWCVCVCARCHDLCTRNEVVIRFKTLDGAQGVFRFVLNHSALLDAVKGWFTARQVWAFVTGRAGVGVSDG